jgi:hypothetical protein
MIKVFLKSVLEIFFILIVGRYISKARKVINRKHKNGILMTEIKNFFIYSYCEELM